jgi:hypothetical protein
MVERRVLWAQVERETRQSVVLVVVVTFPFPAGQRVVLRSSRSFHWLAAALVAMFSTTRIPLSLRAGAAAALSNSSRFSRSRSRTLGGSTLEEGVELRVVAEAQAEQWCSRLPWLASAGV